MNQNETLHSIQSSQDSNSSFQSDSIGEYSYKVGSEIILNKQHFKLLKQIYINGCNSVWLAQYRQESIITIIKITNKINITTNENYHLLQYKKSLTKLKSKYFIKILKFIQTQLYDYFVLQYAKNGDLSNYVNLNASQFKSNPSYKFKWIQKIIYQICLALKDVHKIGYVFRDLKPQNILLDQNLKPKLGDFGLVIPVGTVDKSICGTLQYMPPQRLDKMCLNQKVQYSVDMWSLGILIYQLFNGEVPYYSYSPSDLLDQIYQGYIIYPPDFPIAAKKLINSLLSISPRQRPTIDQVLKHDFFKEISNQE